MSFVLPTIYPSTWNGSLHLVWSGIGKGTGKKVKKKKEDKGTPPSAESYVTRHSDQFQTYCGIKVKERENFGEL